MFFSYEDLKYMTDAEWKQRMKEVSWGMYWKPGPWIAEQLQIQKWQLLLWKDFKHYIHKTRKKKTSTNAEYLAQLKDEYAKKAVGM
jgi:hypothetical protein